MPNFIPMGQASGIRVKTDETVELDAEGRPVNPHIPQFISKAPWYLGSEAKSSLKHQRLNEKTASTTELKDAWYSRGERTGPAATKYRKGACENCGASSHKTKDCLERPRKVGAKWTGRDIQADEIVQNIETSWDSKRDRANGYDFDEHAAMLQANFDRLESLRTEQTEQGSSTEMDKIESKSVAEQTKSQSNSHMRIREDVAGYLAKGTQSDSYDPKSRKMRDTGTTAGTTIDKEGFTRGSNDVAEFEKLQLFAFKGGAARDLLSNSNSTSLQTQALTNVHVQAMPSQAALLYKQQLEAKAQEQALLLEKYGSESHTLPVHLLESTAEERTYSRDGTLVNPPRKIQSKYAEDVLQNGHTTVWGSWYHKEAGTWGFACCKATGRSAYCLAS